MQQQQDEASKIRLLDTWDLTVGRENDPLNPTDMRHYGDTTYRDLVEQMWGDVCGKGAPLAL